MLEARLKQVANGQHVDLMRLTTATAGWPAAKLAEDALGGPTGLTGPPYAARRRFAGRLSVHSG
ncbi:MAG TPA: hypothetical protein VGN32_08410 [Ktedonobacterales bacterium]|nr:hypothetical protein [Ktedonobacterales bacterium]